MTDARQQLIDYISSDAVFQGDFTLTSGKKATYYVDLRKVSLDHRVAPLIGQVMLDVIAQIPDVAAVGGLTMGADPIATAILHQGAARGLAYDAFVVRKEPRTTAVDARSKAQTSRASALSCLKTRRQRVGLLLLRSRRWKKSARSSRV